MIVRALAAVRETLYQQARGKEAEEDLADDGPVAGRNTADGYSATSASCRPNYSSGGTLFKGEVVAPTDEHTEDRY